MSECVLSPSAPICSLSLSPSLCVGSITAGLPRSLPAQLPAFPVLLSTTPLALLRRGALLDSSQVSPFENAMCFLLGPKVITGDLVMKSCQKGRGGRRGRESGILPEVKAGDTLRAARRQEEAPAGSGRWLPN